MKILLTLPFCRPYVRRGLERVLEEMARYLACRGHDVTVLTTSPVGEEVIHDGTVKIVRKRQLGHALLTWVGLGPERLFFLHCLRFMLANRFEAIHCLYFFDACAARLAGFFTGVRYVLHFGGIPLGSYFSRRPLDNLAFRFAKNGAAEVILPSRIAERYLAADFARKGVMIPAPCNLDGFPPRTGRDLDRPRILAVGAFGERRKGAAVLARAFALLKRHLPSAVLQYSGDMPGAVREKVLKNVPMEYRTDIAFLGLGAPEDLPRLYAAAAVTVLPSIWEAQGLVLIESLASGTPVVGSDHGGIPDIVTKDVGVLFDPGDATAEPTNAEGLAAAIRAALALHADPELATRCRRRAEAFGWNALGPRFEEVLERASERCRKRLHG